MDRAQAIERMINLIRKSESSNALDIEACELLRQEVPSKSKTRGEQIAEERIVLSSHPMSYGNRPYFFICGERISCTNLSERDGLITSLRKSLAEMLEEAYLAGSGNGERV